MLPRTAIVVEDDPDTSNVIRLICRESGFGVHAAGSGHEGAQAVLRYRPDIVLLDIGLPDIDGFEVARQIREFSDTRILLLTARTEEADLLTGLGAGADDYVTKPFRPRELRHRIEALMRRPPTIGTPGAPGEENPVWTVLEHNGLELTVQTRTTALHGNPVHLTRLEFDLLHALMQNGRTVLTKPDLAVLITGRPDPSRLPGAREDATVRDAVGKLRRKLGDTARIRRWIETVPGYGYRMTPTEYAGAARRAVLPT